MKTPRTESGIDYQAAAIATVAHRAVACAMHRFEVISSLPIDLKALRTAARSQFPGGNRQMTVPAAQPGFRLRHQCQYFMFAN
jgi:hypothetical protein